MSQPQGVKSQVGSRGLAFGLFDELESGAALDGAEQGDVLMGVPVEHGGRDLEGRPASFFRHALEEACSPSVFLGGGIGRSQGLEIVGPGSLVPVALDQGLELLDGFEKSSLMEEQ